MSDSIRSPLRALLVSQFLGAFNDNAWKLLVTLLGISLVAAPEGQLEAFSQSATSWAFVLFTLPLFLGTVPAGILADRYSKRRILILAKGLEVVLMSAGTLLLLLAPGQHGWLLVVLAGMGLQSALFGPSKYGILPELLPEERLLEGNGLLSLWTFLAILLGTVAGGFLLDSLRGALVFAGLILSVLAVLGFVAAFFIPRAQRAAKRPAPSLRHSLRTLRNSPALRRITTVCFFYWGLASLVMGVVLVYAKTRLSLSDSEATLPLAMTGIGIGVGSLLVAALSKLRVEVGLMMLGALFLALITTLLGLLVPGTAGTYVLMFLLGIASASLVVPLETKLQKEAPAEQRGTLISIANAVSFAGVLLGSLLPSWLATHGFASETILLAAGLASLALALFTILRAPLEVLRAIVALLFRSIYRTRLIGEDRIPEKGGALLVGNHVSYIDGFVVALAARRRVRFLVTDEWTEGLLARLFLRLVRAIPVPGEHRPKEMLRVLQSASNAIADGDLVCLFAEGQITRTGQTQVFRRGMERIMKGRSEPVIPICLAGLWGSLFSYEGRRFVRKWPRQLPYPVRVRVGEPLPASASAADVLARIQGLEELDWEEQSSDLGRIEERFLQRLRRRPWRRAMSDTSGRSLSRLGLGVAGVALAHELAEQVGDSERVGVLLPPSVPAAATQVALLLSARTAVPLNYTVGAEAMRDMIERAKLQHVITSAEFLERVSLELPEGVQQIEVAELSKRISWWKRLRAAAQLFLPMSFLRRYCRSKSREEQSDMLSILFSSGSTSAPKAIPITHRMLTHNIEASAQVHRFTEDDAFLGSLPLFHSFGLQSLCFALTRGMRIAFHPNPLDAAGIGRCVQQEHVTILLATPTFLSLYTRRTRPEQFGSLHTVIAGAERLTRDCADRFEERFGIRPLQGYGATECAPVIATSVAHHRDWGLCQIGSKEGAVGRPLPGTRLRIVDPESYEDLANGETGLLLVQSPSVMEAYLEDEARTQEAFRDAYYVTGDLARIDEDGFLFIADRLSRFSKIGGEMVPHGKIEDALHEVAGSQDREFAVTSLPCEKKGERLVVLTTQHEKRPIDCVEGLKERGLPPLFLPKTDAFVEIAEFPLLGTGKLDLRKLRELAREQLQSA